MDLIEQRAHLYLTQLMSRMNEGPSGDLLDEVLLDWVSRHHRSWWRWPLVATDRQLLQRSMAYIYLRDLGKKLNEADIVLRIESSVDQWLSRSQAGLGRIFDLHSLMTWARKGGVEPQLIWLMDKVLRMESHLPDTIDINHALRKNIKLIIGVVLHELDHVQPGESAEERKHRLSRAISIGYSYGVTYPLIDDLLDSPTFNATQKLAFAHVIRHTLEHGEVIPLAQWGLEQTPFTKYLHDELREAFQTIHTHNQTHDARRWREVGLHFFEAQERDRKHELHNSTLSNEQLYIPIIIKSAYSRLIARQLLTEQTEDEFEQHMWHFGLFNQLSDDMHDFAEDLAGQRVTPFTYYYKHHRHRPDLIHPMQLYWTTVQHLIEVTYEHDQLTTDVLLARVINGQRRLRRRYLHQPAEMNVLFTHPNAALNNTIERVIAGTREVKFLDKLIRDQMTNWIGTMRERKAQFNERVTTIRNRLSEQLYLTPMDEDHNMPTCIIEAANYSLATAGKRFRPIIAWLVAEHYFKLEPEKLLPLFRSLEYMHTASLIFDDLPAQDNARIRRGKPVLHAKYTVAEAELTSLYLTQQAMAEQASLKQHFSATRVLRVLEYTSQTTMRLTQGQWMDLEAKGRKQSLDQLSRLATYKTGLAFEASIVTPAILAGAPAHEIARLSEYADDLGLLFQLKDDILDAEGDASTLGKETGTDAEQGRSTFVTELGLEAAKVEMWRTYERALQRLNSLPRKGELLGTILFAMIHRDH